MYISFLFFFFFFFNDTATTEIYTLSLHDALPILGRRNSWRSQKTSLPVRALTKKSEDRKSTRLNSSHGYISYAVFCLKKKKKKKKSTTPKKNTDRRSQASNLSIMDSHVRSLLTPI